jgi:arylsulfatase A-like enzyme
MPGKESDGPVAGGMSRRELLKRAAGACLAAAGAISLPAGLGCAGRGRRDRPNIILITLDTTRRDRLGCYGADRQTSPNLDRLAEDSSLYTQAFSTSSWTLPAHASLFTGKHPSSHGARHDPEGPLRLSQAIRGGKDWDQLRARGLAEGERTLAGILQEAGYVTGAVVAGPWMKRIFGLDRGFGAYDDFQILARNGRPAAEVTLSASRWVEDVRGERFFLFLNYFDPHGPYFPPPAFRHAFLPEGASPESSGSIDTIRALYDAEILYMDHHIGKLLDRLRELDLYDGTWILVTADHGELLGEHSLMGHGHTLYQEELHVPLLVKHPDGENGPARIDVPVQVTDILPMILERLKIPPPPSIQGTARPGDDRPIIAEVHPLPSISAFGSSRAIIDGGFKFIWNEKGDHLLFHLTEDPGENVNLIARKPDRVKRLASKLERTLAALPKPGPAGPERAVDEETERALKSLGYLQ